jgi:hypothetical protein
LLTDRPPRKCLAPGCPEIGQFTRGRCPDHTRANTRAKLQEKRKDYLNAAWDKFRRTLLGCCNVVCQWVDRDGRRCAKATEIFHHIISVDERANLAYHHENVVGVCRSHHPRPTDEDQGRFVPTLWRAPMSADPLPEWKVGPGESAKPGHELWTLANRLVRFGGGSR